MGKKYKGKYRGSSTRLQNWDYGWNASYFITVNTKYRICHFGHIENGEMQLTGAGYIALEYWNEIPIHFPFVNLGAFVIMPDHIHGIISIQKKQPHRKDTGNIYKTITNKGNSCLTLGQIRFQNQGKGTLSSIVGSYKSVVTKNIRLLVPDFAWQPRFHDSIIRDPRSYRAITKYIENNPKKWKDPIL
jgi:REP element-mobilizing transposase RayT